MCVLFHPLQRPRRIIFYASFSISAMRKEENFGRNVKQQLLLYHVPELLFYMVSFLPLLLLWIITIFLLRPSWALLDGSPLKKLRLTDVPLRRVWSSDSATNTDGQGVHIVFATGISRSVVHLANTT